MNLHHIKHLEMQRADLMYEKQFSLDIKCYSRARNLHLQLRKVERRIAQEQTKLWNFTLRTTINQKTINSYVEIYRYFDQLNYTSRLYDRIMLQIVTYNEALDQIYNNNGTTEISLIIAEINWLRNYIKHHRII